MEKDKIRSTRIAYAEYETDGSMKFITGEDFELYIVTKSKERYVLRNWNLMKRYKKHLQSSYRGDF